MFASSSDSGPLGHCWPWTSQYYKCAWHIELALGVCLPSVEIPAAYVACVIDKVLAYKESCKLYCTVLYCTVGADLQGELQALRLSLHLQTQAPVLRQVQQRVGANTANTANLNL